MMMFRHYVFYGSDDWDSNARCPDSVVPAGETMTITCQQGGAQYMTLHPAVWGSCRSVLPRVCIVNISTNASLVYGSLVTNETTSSATTTTSSTAIWAVVVGSIFCLCVVMIWLRRCCQRGRPDQPPTQEDLDKDACMAVGVTFEEERDAGLASLQELPSAHGSRLGMFSARFDGSTTEERFRNVCKILTAHGFNVLMVEVGPSDNFGWLTMEYLGALKREDGIMLAVATWHYGEWTDHPFGSFHEMAYAVNNNIQFLPLRVGETYPPQPPGGNRDRVEGYISTAFATGVLYIDCRNLSDIEIAKQIAKVLLAPKKIHQHLVT